MMTGNGSCDIIIDNQITEVVDTFPYLGSLITSNSDCTTDIRTGLNKAQGIVSKLGKVTTLLLTQKYGSFTSTHTTVAT